MEIRNQEFYFSISILKRVNENDSKSLIKKVHSTLIVYARIVKSSNRKDNSIEIEIVQVYPFCKRFHFFENEKKSKWHDFMCLLYKSFNFRVKYQKQLGCLPSGGASDFLKPMQVWPSIIYK